MNLTRFFRTAVSVCLIVSALCLVPGCGEEKAAFKCTDPLGCISLPAGAPIRIGVLQALSGKVASLGKDQVRGIELELDRRGRKVAGRNVEFQIEDTGCSAEGGTNAAIKVIADPRTVAVIGTTCSAAAATASEQVTKTGLVLISGNNSAPFLTSVNSSKAPYWQNGYFRTASNEESAGKAAARFAFEHLGVRNAATVDDGDIYTKGLSSGFQKAFEELGGRIVLSITINKGDQDMKPVMTAIGYSRAELVFFPLFQPEGNHLLLQARQNRDLKDVVLMSDGALVESTFLDAVKDKAQGMYFVGPSKPESRASEAMVSAYRKKYSVDPLTSYFLNAVDAANLLFSAIEAIAVYQEDGTLHIGRQALRDALYSTSDFEGITGILNCDRFGDCASPRFNILRMDEPEKGLDGLQANVIDTYTPADEASN